MVIYFSKINCITEDVLEVYSQPEKMRDILDILLISMKQTEYEMIERKVGDDGEWHDVKTTYNLYIQKKENDFVVGTIHKSSRLFYKKDIGNGELKSRSVNSAEAILFYYDVYNEMVGFHTTQRFGYREFNQAFILLINTCVKNEGYDLKFDISLRTEGLNIDDIMERLSKIRKIRDLKIKYQPPNPDSKYIEKLKARGEDMVNQMEEANVTGITMEFSSQGQNGMQVQSELIKNHLEEIQGYSHVIDDKDAIGRGYIGVEATAVDGKRYMTGEEKPVKTEISSLENFVEACKETILKLLV